MTNVDTVEILVNLKIPIWMLNVKNINGINYIFSLIVFKPNRAARL